MSKSIQTNAFIRLKVRHPVLIIFAIRPAYQPSGSVRITNELGLSRFAELRFMSTRGENVN
jgi:hypothetical protein